jgi:hypothetical protein
MTTLASTQAAGDRRLSTGAPPRERQEIFVRYRSHCEWRVETSDTVEADFREACDEADALAAELTRRGVAVYGVLFEPQQYRRWRAARPDSRALRDEWAHGRVAERRGGGVFAFTLGVLRANEPAAPAAEALFGGGENPIGWAILT